MIVALAAISFLQILASQSATKIAKPMSEVEIKKQMTPFMSNYSLRLDFTLIASPDEVLKAL